MSASQLLRRFAALLCVTGAFALCPRLTAASCGDYLQHASHPVSAPLPIRCTGPHCQQAPVAPTAPVVPTISTSPSERWFTALDVMTPGANRSPGLHSRDANARPIVGAHSEIDHVPRAV